MPRTLLAVLALFSFSPSASAQALNACDLNGDGRVTSADVDLAVNMSLGLTPCTANIMGAGVCNIVVTQRVANAIGGACALGTAHSATLSWTASHPDGLPLHFDLYYYRNGSPLPQPLKMNVTGNNTQIDTSLLGGGTAFIRVIATDGFNTAHADSASFTMANKPPLPIIDAPGTGLHVHYGQLVNFSGEALDYQDGSVSSANLSWSDQHGALATGAYWSSDNLLVGTHTITVACRQPPSHLTT